MPEKPLTELSEKLPRRLFCAEQTRKLDELASVVHGIPSITLMRRAGEALWRLIEAQSPDQSISVVAGVGNNGGDGFIVAGMAARRGWTVELFCVGDLQKIGGDALRAFDFARQQGVEPEPFEPKRLLAGRAVVDAVLGTGLRGAPRPAQLAAIEAINAAAAGGQKVFAADIPSGLCADTGSVAAAAVRADHTMTFIALKAGLFTGRGRAFCGRLHFEPLGVPETLGDELPARAQLLDADDFLPLPARARDAHKGRFGRLLVVGGDHGMGGAPGLCAMAAARTGAGLISIITRPEHVSALLVLAPECMASGVDSGQNAEPFLADKHAIAIGPGLGLGAWSQQLLQRVLKSETPLLLDADALNLLASARFLKDVPPRPNWVLTPHPGEAARLLGCAVEEVERDRFAAVERLRQRYGGAVALKGSGTLVADECGVSLCPYGNPGMASGGMGDALSGVIAAFLARGMAAGEAARLGVCVHALAADAAARRRGEHGLLARDLLAPIGRLLNRKRARRYRAAPNRRLDR